MQLQLRCTCVFLVAIFTSMSFGQSAKPQLKFAGTARPASKEAEGVDKSQRWPEEFYVRPLRVDIYKTSALVKNKQINHPPNNHVVFWKNGQQVRKSPERVGWSVEFPNHEDNEILIRADRASKYNIEIYDGQAFAQKRLFGIPAMSGSALRLKLLESKEEGHEGQKVITLRTPGLQESVSLSYAGDSVWYRLVNVTIPADSPLRNVDRINNPPRLRVCLKSDGEYYGNYSTYDRGWTSDYPKVANNCWAVREGTQRRYTVEVWDAQAFGSTLIFSVSGLSATQFRDVIQEEVGSLLGKDRTATITFERIRSPY